MKKTLGTLLLILLMFSCDNDTSSISSAIHNSHYIDDTTYGFTYVVNNQKVEIVSILDSKKDTLKELIIPSEINNYPVVSIESNAFSSTKIENIIFEDDSNLVTIGVNAFGDCSELSSLNLPRSVTEIGESAFYNCSKMESLSFQSNSHLKAIYSTAFYNNTSLGYITLPDQVKIIGDECFYNCESLVEFNITSTINKIGYMAFSNAIHCTISFDKLTEIPETFADDWNYSQKLCDNGTNYVSYTLVQENKEV